MNLKFGKITEVDASKGMAKVTLVSDDNMVTDWLPMMQPKTKQDQYIIPFDINEHVCCIMDDHLEEGVIMGAIYDANNAPDGGSENKNRVKFDGKLTVEYDRNEGILSVQGTGKFKIDVTGDATIKCNNATIDSQATAEIKAVNEIKLTAPVVKVSKDLQVTEKATAQNVQASIEVKAGPLNIPLTTHKHIGVQTGSGTSGIPTP